MKKLLAIFALGMFLVGGVIGCSTPASSGGTTTKETKGETKNDGKGGKETKTETKEEKK